jgi:biotin synthase
VRLSAGREKMNEQLQAWCFFAGANSIFYGEKLLTTSNPETHADRQLFEKLGIHALQVETTVADSLPVTAKPATLWRDAMSA